MEKQVKLFNEVKAGDTLYFKKVSIKDMVDVVSGVKVEASTTKVISVDNGKIITDIVEFELKDESGVTSGIVLPPDENLNESTKDEDPIISVVGTEEEVIEYVIVEIVQSIMINK